MFLLAIELLLISLVLSYNNAAILVSSSIGYYNYRQTSNLLAVYQHLRNFGYVDRDITLMMPENAGCCEKNPIPGSVSLLDGEYTNLNTQLELDHRYSNFNLPELFDVLRGRSHPHKLNKQRIVLD